MNKILKTLLSVIAVTLSVAVVYTIGYRTVFVILNKRAVKNEQQIDFNNTGRGISWIKAENEQTLFFIPSSEELASEELYGSWLKQIHNEMSVNIIVPPFDSEGMTPYLFGKNSRIDRRSISTSYLYRMYSGLLGSRHKITVLSTGDGSLQAMALASEFSSMDKLILISPVHNAPYRRGGAIFHKMTGIPLIHFIVPWLPESFGKSRVGPYDILNDNLNEQFSNSQGQNYPRYINSSLKRQIGKKAESAIFSLSEIKENRFFIIYGDDDLSYGLEGFERMGDNLTESGCEVSIMRVPQSGRMVLFDNGRERILDLITILLQ